MIHANAQKTVDSRPHHDLLTPREAAAFLRTTPATLNTWRCTQKVRIPFVKIGASVRYRHSDLLNFINANLES